MELGRNDYRTRLLDDLSAVGAHAWDALLRASTGGGTPAFLRFDWLDALARTGCVGRGTGWLPRHLALFDGDRLVAAAPLYVK